MKFQLSPTIVLLLVLFVSLLTGQESDPENPVADAFFSAKKVVFLGDSITYQGGFIAALESTLIANGKQYPELLNVGLSSETCSGDSEPAHPWPRPNVHERLQRVIDAVGPDLLIVNYGMNDGIYHPFDKTRFENYINGINKIIEAADKSNGNLKVILVTPPPFDALPVKAKGNLVPIDAEEFHWTKVYENYDLEVLEVYAGWILEQRDRVAGCIDLRTPMLADLAERRKTKPDFHYAHDGVHVDDGGHQLIADIIAKALGLDFTKQLPNELLEKLKQRHGIFRNSWLTESGHKRPGIKDGMPIAEAVVAAKKIDEEIARTIKKLKETKSNAK